MSSIENNDINDTKEIAEEVKPSVSSGDLGIESSEISELATTEVVKADTTEEVAPTVSSTEEIDGFDKASEEVKEEYPTLEIPKNEPKSEEEEEDDGESKKKPESALLALPEKSTINLENIPQELATKRCWTFYKRESGKVSFYDKYNNLVDPTHKSTNFSTLEELKEGIDKYSGLNFTLSSDMDICVVQIKHAKIGDVWNEDALEEANSLNSYSEIIQTKEGASIFSYVFADIKEITQENESRKITKSTVVPISGNVFGEIKTVNEAQEAVNHLHIRWFNKLSGVHTSENDLDYLVEKNISATSDKYKLKNNIRDFITNILVKEDDLIAGDIINFKLKSFGVTKEEIKELISFYKISRKNYKAGHREEIYREQHGLSEDYDGLYTVSEKGAIIPHFDGIADYLSHQNHIVCYQNNFFMFRDGFYRGEPQILRNKITEILRTICGGINSKNMKQKISDVLVHLENNTLVNEYPFNNYKKAFPVNNGVIILDFEKKTFEFREHDPEKFRFNYKIPIDYDPDNKDTTIVDILKQYVDNYKILIQIPANAILQNMGNGPYKTHYFIDGLPDSGKSSYGEMLQMFVGEEGFYAMLIQHINNQFEMASLEGKIFGIQDDLGTMQIKDAGVFKSGCGTRWKRIERKGQQPYSAPIDALWVINMNRAPTFTSNVRIDYAFWERIYNIHFPNHFERNDKFKEENFTPKTFSGFLNAVIEMMLEIGHNKQLTFKVENWEKSREEWLLSGNVLYKMVNSLMKQKEIPDTKTELDELTINKPAITYIIRDELLKALQLWCQCKDKKDGMTKDSKYSLEKIVPQSVAELTELVQACGWDVTKKPFNRYGSDIECYGIPYVFHDGFTLSGIKKEKEKDWHHLYVMLASLSKPLPILGEYKKPATTKGEKPHPDGEKDKPEESKTEKPDTSGVVEAASEVET